TGKLKRKFDLVQPEWSGYANDMTMRLSIDYSYFSALELQNEVQARKRITELYQSHPKDAEIQDTMGFVLMRFATTTAKLDKAEDLFKAAINNPHAEQGTPRLASAHLQDLVERRGSIGGSP